MQSGYVTAWLCCASVQEAARIVRELYSVDMDVPLNGIRYEVPGLLHKFCGS